MRSARLSLILLSSLASVSLIPAAIAQAQQQSTEPPPSEHIVLTVTGKGVQIYTCQLVANEPQWVFDAPDASLFDAAGAKVGVHGAGPSWRYYDGSSVRGEVVAKAASPEPAAIPWLLIKAIGEEDSGTLAKVEFIRRSETHGGNAPAAGCDATHKDQQARIPYTATYTFYSSKPQAQSMESHH
jgi:hypothetical protein